jgi:hypothetical protein
MGTIGTHYDNASDACSFLSRKGDSLPEGGRGEAGLKSGSSLDWPPGGPT